MLRLVPEVHRIIRHCHPCQTKTQKAPVQKDVHRPSVQASAPFQMWSMDILGPLRASSEGNRYLLTLKDVFSKWFEAVPLNRTTSEKVLKALQMLFARFGHPLQIHTDNATYFRSHLMQEAFRRAGIKLSFTPTYNPPVKLGGTGPPRPQRDAPGSLQPTCRRLGRSTSSRPFSPPQRRTRKYRCYPLCLRVWEGACHSPGSPESPSGRSPRSPFIRPPPGGTSVPSP